MKKILIFILVVFGIWLGFLTYTINGLPKISQTSDVNEITVTGISTDLSKVIADNKSSVVTVISGNSLSSGFIYQQINNKIYVVCCLHGIEDKDNTEFVFHNGLKLKGNLKASDIYLDLALLECESDLEVKPVTLGDACFLKDGVFVASVGTSGDLEYDFSSEFGVVASHYREIENQVIYEKEEYDYFASYIQLSSSFVEGFSGAPLINMNGEVVGMVNSKDKDVVLASTINEISLVVNKMLSEEEYHRFNFGFSGFFVEEMENYERNNLNISLDTTSGYYLENIKLGSFAYNIGLTKGDVVLSINGNELSSFDDYLKVIYSMGDSYDIVVIRNNEKIKFEGQIDD